MFKVNGTTPDVGADKYKLNAGDKVEFFYVCDYNKYFAAQTPDSSAETSAAEASSSSAETTQAAA